MPIGTARLAHLCLPGSELHVGVDFDDDRQVRAALGGSAGGDADRPAYLLFPGPHAIDLAEVALQAPITLVVVDGTWWQARKLLKRNAGAGGAAADPVHAAGAQQLPHPARARRPLRGDGRGAGARAGRARGRARAVRGAAAPVRGDDRHAAPLRDARARRAPAARGVPVAAGAAARRRSQILRERAADVVCLHGEANAWPARRRRRPSAGDRALGRAPRARPARRSRRSSPRAARWPRRSPATSASRASSWTRGRELGFVPRALGGVRAPRRSALRVGTLSARRARVGGRWRCPRRASTCGRRRARFWARAPARSRSARRGSASSSRTRSRLGRGGARLAALSAIVDRILAAA